MAETRAPVHYFGRVRVEVATLDDGPALHSLAEQAIELALATAGVGFEDPRYPALWASATLRLLADREPGSTARSVVERRGRVVLPLPGLAPLTPSRWIDLVATVTL